MKKYGVLTWFSTYNYGTALQAYSLTKVLNDNGIPTEVISYKKNSAVISKNKIDKIKDIIVRIPPAIVRRMFWNQFKKRRELFESFIELDIKRSKEYLTKEEIKQDIANYKGFICGSDQIWTPMPEGMDTTYMLDFVPDYMKKISYAPSIGYPQIPEKSKNIMANLISRIDYLSIREEHGAKIIKDICGRDAEVVIDPTLLIDKEQWQNIGIKSNINEPYILCYFLGKRKKTREFVEKLKEKTGCKIVNIPVEVKDLFWGDEQRIGVGPKEFVGLINDATYVCSDSFHGTVFSINLQKNFFALRRHEDNDKKNQNLRLINILSKLNLMDQLVIDEDNYDIQEHIKVDYKESTDLLINERKKSLEFLFNATKEQ